MYEEKYDKKLMHVTYISLVIGVLIGTFFLLTSIALGKNQFFDCGLEQYKISAVLNVPTKDMYIYILKRRVIQCVLYLLAAYIFSYGIATFTANLFIGIYYGMVLSNLIIKFNVDGMIYGVFCFFPHYLLYLTAIFCVGKWIINSFHQEKSYTKNLKKVQYFFKFFVIFLMFLGGLIWEIYFQKNFLKFFYQHLV